MYDLIKLSQSPKLDRWRPMIDLAYDELVHIQSIMNRDYLYSDMFPDADNVFRALELVAPEDVNVVIFGQDPYKDYIYVYFDKETGKRVLYPSSSDTTHLERRKRKRADGLAFSSDSSDPSPSLLNIFSEIDKEFKCNIRKAKKENNIALGDLSCWCRQGVLLLNSSLIAIGGDDKVLNIWHGFIQRVVDHIQEFNKDCIYMLWGNSAINLASSLSLTGSIIKTTHPSPKSANRPGRDTPAFIGSGQFKLCNEELKKLRKPEINWCC